MSLIKVNPNARLVQVKFRGEVVTKAPMVCTPSPNNIDNRDHDGEVYAIVGEVESTGGFFVTTNGTGEQYCLTKGCAHLGGGDWIVVN